ncbi:MAG: glycosyltransferase family 1 protein [Chloroflexota bacterium]
MSNRLTAAIGIDASRAVIAQRTGTEHYSASLLRALAELPEARDRAVVLYVNLENTRQAQERLRFALPETWRVRAIPFPRLWTHVRLSAEMVMRRPGVLFVPSHVVPLLHPRKTVITVHDLGYFVYPQAHTRLSRFYLRVSTWFSVRSAKRVIAISRATKRDLVKYYGVPTGKVRVVYHGCDPVFKPVRDEKTLEDVAARYGVGRPYCLHVGTLQPRKNLGMLVEAWRLLRERMEQPPMLLLAGKRGWLYESLFEQVQRAELEELVKFADYVDRDDLPALYSRALALAFPSLYEGFGLPPLEAMSCGTPVICSNATSLPEVVGDAGIVLDPTDVEAWADAVQSIAENADERERLSQRGLAQAKQFTWERCARETWDVLSK